MTKQRRTVFCLLVLATAIGAGARAQEKAAPSPPERIGVVPVRVQVVITRHQGAKEISRLPYTLAIDANDGDRRAQLRMGAQVPIKSTTFTPAAAEGKPSLSSFSYRDIGTNIDCGPVQSVDGRFRIPLSIEDSSVYADGPATADTPRFADAQAFRSFRTSTSLVLRDGESMQFTAATDRINGEVVRVEVTLNVMK